MKFLPSEYRDIKAAIEHSGLPYHAFTFVKKHGRLHIQHRNDLSPFIFFRKEETHLDAQKQWTKSTTYYVGSVVGQVVLQSWEEVLTAFNRWLSGMLRKGVTDER